MAQARVDTRSSADLARRSREAAKAAHFGTTFISTLRGRAAARHRDQPVVERHLEVHVDAERRIEETVDVGVVQRLDAEDVRSRLEAGDDERAVVATA